MAEKWLFTALFSRASLNQIDVTSASTLELVSGDYRQRIPRPAEFQMGGPPSWANTTPQIRSSVSLARVKRALLANVLPRERTHLARAAVLVPIFEEHGEAQLILTRRSSTLRINPGDIAFPGGHIEKGERAVDAALREAEEEIGLAGDAVEIIGELAVVARPGDGRNIAPFVGALNARPTLFPFEDEVEEVLTVPLASLLADGVAWQEDWASGETTRPVAFFGDQAHLGDNLIWGATARIIWDLLERVVKPELASPPR